MLSANETHLPILVCALTSLSDTFSCFYGSECTAQFLVFLTELTVDAYGEERQVICIFHDLKGYDAIFLQHQLLKEGRRMDMVCVGTKVLAFRVGCITFQDSFCFLPMSLVSFTSTFGPTELKKGFFPHLFNTLDHQDYVGCLPDISFYDPEDMLLSKKKEFETWYASQVEKEVVFNLKYDLVVYCKSDVALLKAGC